ncbi:MAG: S-adenosyl-methyltransferase MraW [Actinobacteria bacterium]|nr:S-adenosyl-methyltransferase MraW [Actinomycetota bacterium]
MGRPDPPYHIPVLAATVAALLQPPPGRLVVDATFGGGGHTRELLAACPSLRVIGIDRDPDAAAEAARLGERVRFVLGDFRKVDALVRGVTCDEIDGVVFDLGVSSHQLDLGDRGLSYHRRGPLDMRLGPDSPLTASDVVNGWDERRLAAVIRRFGEDRHAARIAAAIVAARPLGDTQELADVVSAAVPARDRRRAHPARRTFQAIRITVNDELGALGDGLDAALSLLRPGGRVVVISYHSLEDRIVKRRFAAGATGCVCPPDLPVCGCGRSAELRPLTRRPVVPGEAEVTANPRSRSARLRAAEKVAG